MQIQQTANYASATRLTAYWQNATITASCSTNNFIVTAANFLQQLQEIDGELEKPQPQIIL